MDNQTIHQIGNVLKILENCNLLSIDDDNREEIKAIQNECEKILERYNGNIFSLEDLKDYFDKETYKKVEEALEDGEETTFELEYGQADGIWHNVIYITAIYNEPKTIIANGSYDEYDPIQRILKGETRFEIVLDPMRCITCVEDYGSIGSYFDKLKPNENVWIDETAKKIAEEIKQDIYTYENECEINNFVRSFLCKNTDKITHEVMNNIDNAENINDEIENLFSKLEDQYGIHFNDVRVKNLWSYKK